MADSKFKPGHKLGKGRPKGSINHSTLALRELLKKNNFDPIIELMKMFNEVDTAKKEKVQICNILLDYTQPKIKSVDLETGSSLEAEDQTKVVMSRADLIKIARGGDLG